MHPKTHRLLSVSIALCIAVVVPARAQQKPTHAEAIIQSSNWDLAIEGGGRRACGFEV